jgi:hypothetical protein
MSPLAFSVSIDFYLAQIVVDNFLGALFAALLVAVRCCDCHGSGGSPLASAFLFAGIVFLGFGGEPIVEFLARREVAPLGARVGAVGNPAMPRFGSRGVGRGRVLRQAVDAWLRLFGSAARGRHEDSSFDVLGVPRASNSHA